MLMSVKVTKMNIGISNDCSHDPKLKVVIEQRVKYIFYSFISTYRFAAKSKEYVQVTPPTDVMRDYSRIGIRNSNHNV